MNGLALYNIVHDNICQFHIAKKNAIKVEHNV